MYLSFWYHAVRLLLVSFVHGDSNWNFHRVTDFEKIPVRVSKDEALTPLPLSGLAI